MTLTELFTGIATAIRDKKNSSELISPLNFATEIASIPSGNATPSASDYAQNGLLVQYDGIENTRNGHAFDLTKWENIASDSTEFDLGIDLSRVRVGNTSIACIYDTNKMMTDEGTVLENLAYAELIVAPLLKTQILVEFNTADTLIQTDNYYINFGRGRKKVPYNYTGNQPSMIAVDYENHKFYINGIEYTEHPNTLATNYSDSYNANRAVVLGDVYGTGYDFRGAYYALRVYDRVLSDAERAANLSIDRQRFGVGGDE